MQTILTEKEKEILASLKQISSEDDSNLIIKWILQDLDFARYASELIRPEFFINSSLKHVSRIVFSHLKEFDNLPSKALVLCEVGNADPTQKPYFIPWIKEFYREPISLSDSAAMKQKVYNWADQIFAANALWEVMESINEGNYDRDTLAVIIKNSRIQSKEKEFVRSRPYSELLKLANSSKTSTAIDLFPEFL